MVDAVAGTRPRLPGERAHRLARARAHPAALALCFLAQARGVEKTPCAARTSGDDDASGSLGHSGTDRDQWLVLGNRHRQTCGEAWSRSAERTQIHPWLLSDHDLVQSLPLAVLSHARVSDAARALDGGAGLSGGLVCDAADLVFILCDPAAPLRHARLPSLHRAAGRGLVRTCHRGEAADSASGSLGSLDGGCSNHGDFCPDMARAHDHS